MTEKKEPTIFKTLPKDERKALRKEFNKTETAKSLSIGIIIGAIVLAMAMIGSSIVAAVTDASNNMYYLNTIFILMIIPYIVMEDAFFKWLKKEKNIVRKIKKPKSEQAKENS